MSYNGKYTGKQVEDLLGQVGVIQRGYQENGVYILHTNGGYYKREDWDTAENADAVGVAVIADEAKFVIDKNATNSGNAVAWGVYGENVAGLSNITSESNAKADYDGASNTDKIIAHQGTSTGYAAQLCQILLGHGKRGYLGSLGQWQIAYNNKTEVDACMSAIGGTALGSNYYWSSTECSSDHAWGLYWSSGDVLGTGKGGTYRVRAFASIDPQTIPIKDYIDSKTEKIDPSPVVALITEVMNSSNGYVSADTYNNASAFLFENNFTQTLKPTGITGEQIGLSGIDNVVKDVMAMVDDENICINIESMALLHSTYRNAFYIRKSDYKIEYETYVNQIAAGTDGDINIFAVLAGSETGRNSEVHMDLHTAGDGSKVLANNGQYVDFLKKDNTAEYTPTEDYNPATKKYVDDATAELRGSGEIPANGVYILDTDGNYFTSSEWDTANNAKAVGVAVIADEAKFVIDKNATSSGNTVTWGVCGTDVTTLTNITSSDSAKLDYDGLGNTDKLIAFQGASANYAAQACRSVTVGGKSGYLGSLGQWQIAYNNKTEVYACMSAIGGTALGSSYYWSSTEYNSNDAWLLHWGDGNVGNGDKDYTYRVRAFASLPDPVKSPIKQYIDEKVASVSPELTEEQLAQITADVIANLPVYDGSYE